MQAILVLTRARWWILEQPSVTYGELFKIFQCVRLRALFILASTDRFSKLGFAGVVQWFLNSNRGQVVEGEHFPGGRNDTESQQINNLQITQSNF